MNILILMIPIALLLALGFVLSFAWAVENGQFEDMETPAHRILENDNNEDLERKQHERVH